jgi:hypothetical protein
MKDKKEREREREPRTDKKKKKKMMTLFCFFFSLFIYFQNKNINKKIENITYLQNTLNYFYFYIILKPFFFQIKNNQHSLCFKLALITNEFLVIGPRR